MLDITTNYAELEWDQKLELLQPVAKVLVSPTTYSITLSNMLADNLKSQIISAICLARPMDIDWLTLKQAGQNSFTLVQHVKTMMTLNGEQNLTLKLSDFCKIHLKVGCAYAVSDIYLWLNALLGSKVQLYQAVGADAGFATADLTRGMSPDFQNLLYLLQFWDGNDLYKLNL